MASEGVRASPRPENVAALLLLQHIALVANEAATLDEAMQAAVDEVCRYTGWPVGHAYRLADDDPDRMDPTKIWHLDDERRFRAFRELTERRSTTRGQGIAGEVLASGQPLWIMDVLEDGSFTRAFAARDVGVRGAFAFPVMASHRVVAVLEFFSSHIERPNAAMLELVAYVGTQIGRVAEREAAAAALVAQVEHTRTLIESAYDAFVEMDEGGVITGWNAAAETIFGWPRSEAVGRSLADTMIPPKQRSAHAEGLRNFLENGGERVLNKRLEFTALHHDGHEIPVELAIWPVRRNGRYVFCAFIRDITERKKAEEGQRHLAAVAQGAEDAIITKSIHGTILSFNRGAEKLYGYKEAEVIGDSIAILAPYDRPDEFPSILERIRRGESGAVHYDTVRKTKDGRLVDVSLTITPIKDQYGIATGVSTIARDITERKQAEQRLQEAYQRERATVLRLRELDQAKTIFVSSVSHELRTPLTSIIGYLELLRSDYAGGMTSTQDEMLEVIERNSKRLRELIEDLLMFSRLEAGTYRPRIGVVAASELFSTVRGAILPDAAARSLELRFDDPGDIAFLGDSAQIERVLLNLLSNAMKFTPPGGRVSVRAEQSGDGVTISVQDTGIGVPEEDIPRLFSPFFRSSAADKQAIQGTGLGLAIVKAIVDGHGGTIRVTSRVDVGTTVTIRLAAARAGSEARAV